MAPPEPPEALPPEPPEPLAPPLPPAVLHLLQVFLQDSPSHDIVHQPYSTACSQVMPLLGGRSTQLGSLLTPPEALPAAPPPEEPPWPVLPPKAAVPAVPVLAPPVLLPPVLLEEPPLVAPPCTTGVVAPPSPSAPPNPSAPPVPGAPATGPGWPSPLVQEASRLTAPKRPVAKTNP